MGEETAWQKAVSEELEAKTYFHSLETAPEKQKQKAAQDWFKKLAILIDAANQYKEEAFRTPKDLLNAMWPIKGIAAELAQGRVLEIVTVAKAHSGLPTTISELNDIGLATLYLRFVEDGTIIDKTPIKTVQDIYKVGRTTAQRWKKLEILTNFDEYDGQEDFLKRDMENAGRRYQDAGRGQNSVASRGAPKTP